MSWLPDRVLDHLRQVVDLPDLTGTPYQIVRLLARGGMGSVYLAEDTKLRRNIALKVLNQSDDDGELAERMLQEAYIIAALEHPGIVPIHDVGRLPDGRVFYTMKYVRGSRLDEWVQRARSETELLRLFQKICEAVAFAHAHKVVHRDLKPDNIMVGDFGEVLVMDWGLSKVLDRLPNAQRAPGHVTLSAVESEAGFGAEPARAGLLTEHGTIMGTPMYMSPEQARGATGTIDHRTDIFALGAILHFMLHHFRHGAEQNADRGAAVRWLRHKRKLPKRLMAIVNKASAENKDERYSSALDLRADVEHFLDGLPVSAYREQPWEAAWRWLKQNRFLISLILVYILVRLILFFFSRL